AERFGLAIAERLEDRRGQLLEVVGPAGSVRKVRDAEDLADPVADQLPLVAGAELDLDAAHDRSDRLDVEIGERPLQMPRPQPDEPGTIASLQRELLVVNDDGIHDRGARLQPSVARSAARCPERTADSIVPGRPVSIQSPAR